MSDYMKKYNNYNEYLSGDVWEHNRAYLRSFDYYHSCHVCGCNGDIDLHHNNYTYAAIKLQFPPPFVYPLCTKHHAEVTALAKTLGHKKATDELCAKYHAPQWPNEYSRYLETVGRATQLFTRLGVSYLQYKRAPSFLVQEKGELNAVWVTNKYNALEVKILLECPLEVKKYKVLERQDGKWTRYILNGLGEVLERKEIYDAQASR